MQPAVPYGLRCFLVALPNIRPSGSRPDTAVRPLHVGRQVSAVGINHTHAAAEHRPAARKQFFADVMFVGQRGNGTGGFGQPVELRESGI